MPKQVILIVPLAEQLNTLFNGRTVQKEVLACVHTSLKGCAVHIYVNGFIIIPRIKNAIYKFSLKKIHDSCPKKKSIHYPQEQSLKPLWCVLVWKDSQLGMKNEHIPGAQNDEYPHFKRGLPVDYWIHQSRGSNPNVPLKVLIMYVTNISLQAPTSSN